jgi:hypothetical protein
MLHTIVAGASRGRSIRALGGGMMQLRHTAVLILVFGHFETVIGGESTQPPPRPIEFATYGVLQRIQVYADFCSAKVPAMQADFADLMTTLTRRVNEIARPLALGYAHDPDMQRPLPREFIEAYEAWNSQLRSQLDAVDPRKECPGYLANYRNTPDDFFRAGIQHSLETEKAMMSEGAAAH